MEMLHSGRFVHGSESYRDLSAIESYSRTSVLSAAAIRSSISGDLCGARRATIALLEAWSRDLNPFGGNRPSPSHGDGRGGYFAIVGVSDQASGVGHSSHRIDERVRFTSPKTS
jgi:hypothetical protein